MSRNVAGTVADALMAAAAGGVVVACSGAADPPAACDAIIVEIATLDSNRFATDMFFQGEPIIFEASMTNSSTRRQTLELNGCSEADILVYDPQGRLIIEQSFQAGADSCPVSQTFEAGEVKTFSFGWGQRIDNDTAASPGEYEVAAWSPSDCLFEADDATGSPMQHNLFDQKKFTIE